VQKKSFNGCGAVSVTWLKEKCGRKLNGIKKTVSMLAPETV